MQSDFIFLRALNSLIIIGIRWFRLKYLEVYLLMSMSTSLSLRVFSKRIHIMMMLYEKYIKQILLNETVNIMNKF